jgi:hypothetical protein
VHPFRKRAIKQVSAIAINKINRLPRREVGGIGNMIFQSLDTLELQNGLQLFVNLAGIGERVGRLFICYPEADKNADCEDHKRRQPECAEQFPEQ